MTDLSCSGVISMSRYLLSSGARRTYAPIDAWLRGGDLKRLGSCAACGAPVHDGDAFLRYRGEYFHGGPCVEHDPPALRHGPALGATDDVNSTSLRSLIAR